MEIIEQEKKMTASYYDDYDMDCSACGDITYSAAPRNT